MPALTILKPEKYHLVKYLLKNSKNLLSVKPRILDEPSNSLVRYAHHFSPTVQVKFCGCARVGVYLIAWCRMSWQFDSMRRLVVQASSVLQKIVVD
jgi:hypothetical protein